MKRAWFPGAFRRFEIEFRQVDAVPVKAFDHLLQSGADGLDGIAVLQIHQLAPVELRVLQCSRSFAPLRMVVPEFFADMRQFDPGVYTSTA